MYHYHIYQDIYHWEGDIYTANREGDIYNADPLSQ